jgi:hypothetical protein
MVALPAGGGEHGPSLLERDTGEPVSIERLIVEKGRPMAHLWEFDHPYYGADGQYKALSSFAELREALANHPHDGSTVIYRWDWHGPHSPNADPDEPEELVIFGLFPRKSMTWSLSCPINKDQEAEVRDWLRGPDVLGQLTPMWTPLLDEVAPSTKA